MRTALTAVDVGIAYKIQVSIHQRGKTMHSGIRAGGNHRMREMYNGKSKDISRGSIRPEPEVDQSNREGADHMARKSRTVLCRNMQHQPCHLRGVRHQTLQRQTQRTTMGQ